MNLTSVETFVTDVINNNVWKVIPFLLIAAGVYFGLRTVIVQVRMFPDMLRSLRDKPDQESGAQDISAFKAFTISAASRVGTGNVVGVAIAISVGGPGAMFWLSLIHI